MNQNESVPVFLCLSVSANSASLAWQQPLVGDPLARAFAAEHSLSGVTHQRRLPRRRRVSRRRVHGRLRSTHRRNYRQ